MLSVNKPAFDPSVDIFAHATEHNAQQDACIEANNEDEGEANQGSGFRVADKIGHPHHAVKQQDHGALVESLNVVRIVVFHRLEPLQQNYNKSRGKKLTCKLTPEKVLPVD